jgi:hypothetical protein
MTKVTVQKEFLGKIFSYETVADENGNALWTSEIDKLFSKWLYDLKNENRELFKVQYSLSTNAYDVLNKLKERIGVYDDSLIIRAITITFINFIDTRKGRIMIKHLNFYRDSGDLALLNAGEILKKNLYFSPIGMRDVEAYAKLTGLKKSKVVKNALYSVLLISINEDKEIKHFWEQEILDKLTTIVKAA